MKKFLAALLALVMVLTLAACGGDTTPPPADSGTETEAHLETVTVYFFLEGITCNTEVEIGAEIHLKL